MTRRMHGRAICASSAVLARPATPSCAMTAGLQVPFNDGSVKAIAQQMSQWIAEHQV